MLRTSAIRLTQRAALPQARLISSAAALARQTTLSPASVSVQARRWKSEDAGKTIADKNRELQRDWDAKVISYDDLKPKTISPNPDAYLIDVREPDEVAQGMIPSAVNVPLTVLPNSLHLSPEAFKEAHGFDKPKKDQEITFYCRSGMRSTTASDVAKRNGYTNILNYKGSWLEWVQKRGEQ